MLGLKELISRSKPDECPFCGEPKRPRSDNPDSARRRETDFYITCGDEICKKAYHIFYGRDRRNAMTPEQREAENRRKRISRRNKNK